MCFTWALIPHYQQYLKISPNTAGFLSSVIPLVYIATHIHLSTFHTTYSGYSTHRFLKLQKIFKLSYKIII
jgi:hypothetical protein